MIKKKETLENGEIREWQYEWDALDQLRSVTNPDGETWQYAYDPFGRRIEKKSPDGQRFGFVWDEDVVLHELREDAVFASWVFDPHSFSPLCKLENDQLYCVVTDHLGTPWEMVDRYGRIAWRASYYAWGTEKVSGGNVGEIDCPVRFKGQWYDDETGLHYNRFRYYDPQNGRFISNDPIGLVGGVNLYLYALNPNTFFDPLGLVSAPSSLPNEPGIYIITNGNESYVGSSGIGKQGMHGRVSDTGHTNAQRLLNMEGTKVQYVRVDLGTATSRSDRNNILRHFEHIEQQKQVARGFEILNDAGIQDSKKVKSTEDLIKEHNASAKKRRTTCK